MGYGPAARLGHRPWVDAGGRVCVRPGTAKRWRAIAAKGQTRHCDEGHSESRRGEDLTGASGDASHIGGGSGSHLLHPAPAACRARQAAGHRRERAAGPVRMAAHRHNGRHHRLRRRGQPPVRRRRLSQKSDRSAHRHRAGDAHTTSLQRRQDASHHQSREEPGDGRTRHADPAGADQLHQRRHCLCRRDPGAAGAGAEREQRAGACQAAASDQRPLPCRRDHPHRRRPGRGRSGWCDSAASDLGRQPADRARHLPAGRRLPAARRSGRAAAARPAGEE